MYTEDVKHGPVGLALPSNSNIVLHCLALLMPGAYHTFLWSLYDYWVQVFFDHLDLDCEWMELRVFREALGAVCRLFVRRAASAASTPLAKAN